MSETVLNPLESILRLCAAAAPEPWYPRLYVKQTGVDAQALGRCLEELALDGLIQKTAGTPETGPAITLTREGERLLLDPEALDRFRAGRPLSPGDRGAIVRQALRGPLRPRVTVLLVLVNVLVFAGGWYAAREIGADNAFLRGDQSVRAVHHLLERSGSLSARSVIEGEWWRLLAAGFVHIGFMHLLLNMTFLYLAGRFIEQMWGHVRYLVIYLAGVLGGGCLALAHNADGVAGASGAVCGLLGAQAVWFLFQRRYLPRTLLRQAWTSQIINLVLLVFISSFKGVSGWAHLGGALAGAAAALLLHLQRFGPPLWRWMALAGFVPLTWYGYYAIEQARATDPKWQQAEKEDLRERFARPLLDAMNQAADVYDDEATPLLQKHPTRRKSAEVEAMRQRVAEQERILNELAERIGRAGPYRDPDTEAARQAGQEYAAATAELFAQVDHVLQVGDRRTDQDRRELHQQGRKVIRLREAWEEAIRD